MGKLALIGTVILSWHGGHHVKRYWWPAMDTCTVGTIEKGNAFRVPVGIVCTTSPAHWSTKPLPPEAV